MTIRCVSHRGYICIQTYTYIILTNHIRINPYHVLSQYHIKQHVPRVKSLSHISIGINHTLYSKYACSIMSRGNNYYGQLGSHYRNTTQQNKTCITNVKYHSQVLIRKLEAGMYLVLFLFGVNNIQ